MSKPRLPRSTVSSLTTSRRSLLGPGRKARSPSSALIGASNWGLAGSARKPREPRTVVSQWMSKPPQLPRSSAAACPAVTINAQAVSPRHAHRGGTRPESVGWAREQPTATMEAGAAYHAEDRRRARRTVRKGRDARCLADHDSAGLVVRAVARLGDGAAGAGARPDSHSC